MEICRVGIGTYSCLRKKERGQPNRQVVVVVEGVEFSMDPTDFREVYNEKRVDGSGVCRC